MTRKARRPLAVGRLRARNGGPPPPTDRGFLRGLSSSREVRNELAKVAWPNRQEVVKYTIVVFVTLVFMVSLVFGLDYGFAKGVLFLFGT